MNWLPGGDVAAGEIIPGMKVVPSRSPVDFSDLLLQTVAGWDEEPDVGFCERDGQVVVSVGYALDRFSAATMTRFATNITAFLTTMLATPTRRVGDVELK